MDQFSKSANFYNLQARNRSFEESHNIKEVEFTILKPNKSPGLDGFTEKNFTKCLKKNKYEFYLTSPQKTESNKTLQFIWWSQYPDTKTVPKEKRTEAALGNTDTKNPRQY